MSRQDSFLHRMMDQIPLSETDEAREQLISTISTKVSNTLSLLKLTRESAAHVSLEQEINAVDAHGQTLIMKAIRFDCFRIFTVLVDYYPIDTEVPELDRADDTGKTALLYALQIEDKNKKARFISELMGRKIKIGGENKESAVDPLVFAFKTQSASVLELLLFSGNPLPMPFLIEQIGCITDVEILIRMIKAGVPTGTLLIKSIKDCNPDFIYALLELKLIDSAIVDLKVDIFAEDDEGDSAISYTVRSIDPINLAKIVTYAKKLLQALLLYKPRSDEDGSEFKQENPGILQQRALEARQAILIRFNELRDKFATQINAAMVVNRESTASQESGLVATQLQTAKAFLVGLELVHLLEVKKIDDAKRILNEEKDIDFMVFNPNNRRALSLACELNDREIINGILQHPSNNKEAEVAAGFYTPRKNTANTTHKLPTDLKKQLQEGLREELPLYYSVQHENLTVIPKLIAKGALIYDSLKRTKSVTVAALLLNSASPDEVAANELGECLIAQVGSSNESVVNIILTHSKINIFSFSKSLFEVATSPEVFAALFEKLKQSSEGSPSQDEKKKQRDFLYIFIAFLDSNQTPELQQLKLEARSWAVRRQLIVLIQIEDKWDRSDSEAFANKYPEAITLDIVLEEIKKDNGSFAIVKKYFKIRTELLVEKEMQALIEALFSIGVFQNSDKEPIQKIVFARIGAALAQIDAGAITAVYSSLLNLAIRAIDSQESAKAIDLFKEYIIAAFYENTADINALIALLKVLEPISNELIVRLLPRKSQQQTAQESKEQNAESIALVTHTIFEQLKISAYEVLKINSFLQLYDINVMRVLMARLSDIDAIKFVEEHDFFKVASDSEVFNEHYKIILVGLRNLIAIALDKAKVENITAKENAIILVENLFQALSKRLKPNDSMKLNHPFLVHEIHWLKHVHLLMLVEFNSDRAPIAPYNKLDLNIRNAKGEPLILIAERHRNHELVKTLVKAGADLSAIIPAPAKPELFIVSDAKQKSATLKLFSAARTNFTFNDIVLENIPPVLIYPTIEKPKAIPQEAKEYKDDDEKFSALYQLPEPADILSLAVHQQHDETINYILGLGPLEVSPAVTQKLMMRALDYVTTPSRATQFINLTMSKILGDGEEIIISKLMISIYQGKNTEVIKAFLIALQKKTVFGKDVHGYYPLQVAVHVAVKSKSEDFKVCHTILEHAHQIIMQKTRNFLSKNFSPFPVNEIKSLIGQAEMVKTGNEDFNKAINGTLQELKLLSLFSYIYTKIYLDNGTAVKEFFTQIMEKISLVFHPGHLLELCKIVLRACTDNGSSEIIAAIGDFQAWLAKNERNYSTAEQPKVKSSYGAGRPGEKGSELSSFSFAKPNPSLMSPTLGSTGATGLNSETTIAHTFLQ